MNKKINNPIVLVNTHKDHQNSLSVCVTDGSYEFRDLIKGCIADLDEVHPDDAMDKLPLEVLYYTATALENERNKYRNLRPIFENCVRNTFLESADMHDSGAYVASHVQFAWNVLREIIGEYQDFEGEA